MQDNYSRRSVLKVSGSYGAGFGALASAGVPRASTLHQFEKGPWVNSEPELFRLVDSGFERATTQVILRHEPTGRVVDTFELRTTGTNHPDVKRRPHEERFPAVAADIDSFSDVPPGHYELVVRRGNLVGQTTFTVGQTGLPESYNLHARILPDGRLDVGSTYSQPSLPTG